MYLIIPATSAETTTNGTDLTSAKGIEYAHTYWCEGHTNVQGPKGQGTLGVVKFPVTCSVVVLIDETTSAVQGCAYIYVV